MGREKLEEAIAVVAAKLEESLDSPTEDVLDQGLSLFEEVETYLTHSVYDSDSESKPDTNIVVLGTTGTGKSTIVSFLFGEGRMLVHHETPFSRVLVSDPPLHGVSIRSGCDSTTLLPICNHVKLGEEVIAAWDMPGSRDTRGPFVELLVHFIFKWMLVDDKTLRFIIVSPPLHEHPQIASLQNTINGSLIRPENAVIVYTKCSWDFDPGSTSFALPAPVQSDEEGHDYSAQYQEEKSEILTALTKLRSDSVNFEDPLPDAAQRLLDKFKESSVAFARDKISKCFLKVYDWKAYRGSLDEMENTLDALKTTEKLSLEAVLVLISRLIPTKDGHVHSDDDITQASRRLHHVGILVGTAHHNLSRSTRRQCAKWRPDAISALENAKEKLVGLRNDVKAYHRSENAFHLRLSEEQAAIEKFVKKREMAIDGVDTIPNVILIGFASLEVDLGLEMWANVALVSPSIQVTTERVFDLSAVGQAPSAEKCNDVAGQDGIHGEPGLPGGNLAVVCDNLTDEKQMLRASLSSGQRGGDAQHGGDGISGADSRYDKNAFLDAINAEIDRGLLFETDKELPRNLEGGLRLIRFEEVDSPLGGIFYGSPGRKDLTITRESDVGSLRNPAGSGGRGGFGGKGGVIVIRSARDVWGGAGLVGGHQGLDGIGGAVSRDGFSSPRFTATIQQWYYRGGWFSSPWPTPKIKAIAEPVPLEDQSKFIHAKPAMGEGAGAFDNTGLGLGFVRTTYEGHHSQLASAFCNCDFSDLMVKWE
ncbi:hypothetical protein PHYSODRAFT_312701 [Phytophthora sojae]|uniref:Uncharacterized protein n=1 Tax=Phytophthora sojae (strain P6497) TaxID=1094619 RepID=G4Z6L6_PHYSP|nr:hypothetical protein PHYSODRAFT_312701 [Phytophthora sojae]EGZ19586.1 hypothetical protein PHYSODRAFT_312701 [Phytophthora sojae]|eukprot:XP_009522303.1 hypothetical protein PHYSODRAFT_312701 [Phytophthora sojae]